MVTIKPTESEQKDIFELLHRRRRKSSTIFCSQYDRSEWYDQLGSDAGPLDDAIIDRIAHDSYVINITSIDDAHDISMREVYGLDKNLPDWRFPPDWMCGFTAREYSLLAEKPSSEIMTVIFLSLIPEFTLLKKRQKSFFSNVNFMMLRMHLMCKKAIGIL